MLDSGAPKDEKTQTQSRMCEGSGIVLYLKASKSVAISWMLAEDTRLLGQRQRSSYSWHSRWNEHHADMGSLYPLSPAGT